MLDLINLTLYCYTYSKTINTEGGNMWGLIILIILIISASILFGFYMYLCAENKVGMFADSRYKVYIEKLEKMIKELKEEK